MVKKVYLVENLDCANCAAKMERKIQAMSEIQAASITFATKQLRFAADDPESLVPQLEKACKTIEDEVTLVPKDNTPAPRIKKESVWSEHRSDLISIIAGAALFAAGMIAEHAMSAVQAYSCRSSLSAIWCWAGKFCGRPLRTSQKVRCSTKTF